MIGTAEPRLLRRLALFSADPWNSALPILRVRGPAEAAGVEVIQGNDGDTVWPERAVEGDLIVIQRDFPRFQAYEAVLGAARAAGKPIVYESDDLLFDVPAHHPAHEAYSDHLLSLVGAILQADLVVVSTPQLAEAHLPFNPNTHVWLNHLNEQLWTLRQPPPAAPASIESPCVIGYMGGATHQPDLEMIAGVLGHLLDRYAGRLRLHFWSAPPPASLRDRPGVAWTPLDPHDYARSAALFSAQTCAIAIAPLVDTPLGRAKSHLKFLEYTALGAPGIYSRLPPYTGIVRHDENGLLAGEIADWEKCLVELIESPERRHTLALSAHADVRDRWMMARGAPEWRALYEAVLQPGYRRQPLIDGRQTLAHIAAVVQARQHALEQHLGELREQARELGERRGEIETIYASPAWRLAQTLGQWRARLAPDGSTRQRLLDAISGLKRPNKTGSTPP